APGMIDLDVRDVGASFYAANCHKWICAPKGSAFLYVAERHRSTMHAAVVSHGYNDGWPESGNRFHAQFDWTGTDDPTARLSVPEALRAIGEHHADGWRGIRRSNHELVIAGRSIVADALGVSLPAPSSMIGSIASLPLPAPVTASEGIFDGLMNVLHDRWKIEVPVFAWPEPPDRVIRVSAQQYNTLDHYERLAEALRVELS
ncbi:MAG: isopenicillin-N epimerase, partial [Verrucomicrobiales bacterium]